MKEEREELIKKIFPQLKKYCEQRHIEFNYVDLRWGITEEVPFLHINSRSNLHRGKPFRFVFQKSTVVVHISFAY
jgi:hypothetical protein